MLRYSSIRTTGITKEIKEAILTKETETSKAVISTDKQLTEVENNLENLQLDNTQQNCNQNAESTDTAIQQVEQERSFLNLSRKLLEELLLKIRDEAGMRVTNEGQDHSTHTTFGNLGKGFQIVTNNGPISGFNF